MFTDPSNLNMSNFKLFLQLILPTHSVTHLKKQINFDSFLHSLSPIKASIRWFFYGKESGSTDSIAKSLEARRLRDTVGIDVIAGTADEAGEDTHWNNSWKLSHPFWLRGDTRSLVFKSGHSDIMDSTAGTTSSLATIHLALDVRSR